MIPSSSGSWGAAENAAGEQAIRLRHRLGLLRLLANLGPLFGNLGTVACMVESLRQVATARGCCIDWSPALVTTVWVLLVAIVSSVFYFVLEARAKALEFGLSAAAMEMVRRLKPAAGTRPQRPIQ